MLSYVTWILPSEAWTSTELKRRDFMAVQKETAGPALARPSPASAEKFPSWSPCSPHSHLPKTCFLVSLSASAFQYNKIRLV